MKIAIIFLIGFVAFASAQNEEPDQYLPEQNKVNENVPELNEVSENVTEQNKVNENVPEMNEVKENVPELNEVKENVPEMNEVKENVPELNEVKENVTEMNEVKENVPELNENDQTEHLDNIMSEVEDVVSKNKNNRGESKQLCKEAKLYRNPENCGTFYSCAVGHYPYLMDCPAGLSFNEKMKICDWPQNVEC